MMTALYGPQELSPCPSSDLLPHWWSGVNKLFSPCPDVNVGIATNDPLHKLDVRGNTYSVQFLAGNINATTQALYNGFSQNSSQDLMQLGKKVGANPQEVKFRIQNAGSIQTVNSGSAPSLTMQNGTGHAFVIYAHDGTKILQLEDNGTLNAREVKVNTNTWPDYVFDNRYKLMSLTETEDYINKNGRLPGVPSATNVIEDGLNVGEMQVIQMEKMEEIYLHLIDLDKRVKGLEEENEALRKENTDLKSDK